jgi:hypothetical protein
MGVQEFVNNTLRRPAVLLPVAGVLLVLDLVAVGVTGGSRLQTEDKSKNPAAGEVSPGESLVPEAVASAEAAAKAAAAKKKSTSTGTKVGVNTAISDTEIAVGMIYVTNPGTANQAAGFSSTNPQVDQKRAWELMVKEVNKNAPFGRKVVPVFFSTSEENATSKGETLWEEACTKWTKDNKVFLAWVSGTDTLKRCLKDRGVAQIGGGGGYSYEKTYKDYPWLIEPTSAALDRMAQFEVDQLHARGFFSKCKTTSKADLLCTDGQPRIALFRYDQPAWDAAAARMKAALASHGLSLCRTPEDPNGCEFEMTLGATADVRAQLDDTTELTSFVTSCKGVNHTAPGAQPGPCTHLLFLGEGGCRQQPFYMPPAEQQNFRPRLGLNSLDCDGAEFWDDNHRPDYPENQYNESIYVGHNPGEFGLRPAAFQECKKIFEAGGETFGGSDDPNNEKEDQIDFYCDTAWYHIAAFNKVGRTVNLDTFLGGVANTGLVKSAGTFLMQTTATRHDGAGAIRIGQWDPGECRCFKPITGDIPV